MKIKILITTSALLFFISVTACGQSSVTEFRSSETTFEDKNARFLLSQLLPKVDSEPKSAALNNILKTKDKRFIAPLVDILRFQRTRQEYQEVFEALVKLSGVESDDTEDYWTKMTIWVAEKTDIKPPPGYTKWKGDFHAQQVDPRFREFLYEGAKVAKETRVEEVVWGGVKVDGIPALVNPKMLSVNEATYLNDSEPVFGVSINGDSRAYPLRIIDWHEMVNDVVGGKPVALAYCTLCGAGILFDATLGKQKFEFGSSGFLMRSNKLMFDRATKTLWNQLTGKPVIGKLVGKELELKVLPVVLTSWGEWKSEHRNTSVLSLDTGHDRPYKVGATYGRYFASPKTLFPVRKKISSLSRKARIFAIQSEGLAKAYPLDELNKSEGLVNDSLGKKNLVVIYRDAIGRVPLSDKLKNAFKNIDSDFDVEYANDLTLKPVKKLLKKQPNIINEFTIEMMLAIPTETRLTILHENTSDRRVGKTAKTGNFTPDFRNEVAQRGLIGDTRAYERGSYSFKKTKNDDELIDQNNKIWRVTETSLVSPNGEKLERLGGHLAYWFGWVTYFSQTEVYKAK